MNLDTAFEQIADYLHMDAATLKQAAQEDTYGGYHSESVSARFPAGSIWGVEGQVLYALVRTLHPAEMLELGVYHGASSTHLIAALQANNDGGHLTSVDHHSGDSGAVEIGDAIPAPQKADFNFVEKRAQHYLEALDDASLDFIFEDVQHDVLGTSEIWTLAQAKLAPGGVIVSHDAMHPTAGPDVRAGITSANIHDALSLLIEPSDCGLALWRKPGDTAPTEPKPKKTTHRTKAATKR